MSTRKGMKDRLDGLFAGRKSDAPSAGLIERIAAIKPGIDFQDHSYISLKNRYFFHTIGKAANSTVKHVCYQLELQGTRSPMPSVHDRASAPLLAPRQLNEDLLKDVLSGPDYFRFTFVRDPFARLLSCYLDRIADRKSRPYRQLIAALGKERGYRPGFAEFIEAICAQSPYEQNNHWRVQYDDAMMAEIAYDHIGRQESFDADMDAIMARITGKTQSRVAGEVNASPAQTSSGSRLGEFWDRRLARLVQDHFARDFEHFGYEAEPGWLASATGVCVAPPAPLPVKSPNPPAAAPAPAPALAKAVAQPRAARAPAIAPERRSIRLKEFGPSISRTVAPTPRYLRQTNGSIEAGDYAIETDPDGFILAPQHRGREGERIYVLGDSFVECSFIAQGSRFCDLLNDRLAGRDATVLNGGYSGSTMLHLFNRLMNKVVHRAPAHVVVVMPSNDVLALVQPGGYWNFADQRYAPVLPVEEAAGEPDFEGNAQALAGLVRLFCSAARDFGFRLTLATMPFVARDYRGLAWLRIRHKRPKVYEELIAKRQMLNRILSQAARAEGADLLDLENAFDPAMFYDDVHLNEAGCRCMAELLAARLL